MAGAVLFDVDGVLVHPRRFRTILWRKYRISSRMTEPFFRGPFVDCLEGRADLFEVLPPFLKSWRWSGSTRQFVETWLDAENAPHHEVLDIVKELRGSGIPCFVASTQERYRARYLAGEMRFEKMFDGLFFSSDVGFRKPDRNFFRAVTNHPQLAASEIVFFDDALECVQAARSAGWSAEQFRTAGKLRKDVARHTGFGA